MMMLRNRASSQRLIQNNFILRSRRLRDDNYVGIPVFLERWIRRRSSSVTFSASAHQWRASSIFATDHGIPSFRGKGDTTYKLAACCVSSCAVPDLVLSEKTDQISDLNINDGSAGDAVLNFENDKLLDTSPRFNTENEFQRVKHDRKPENSEAIPKQSTRAAQLVFQSIAPHVETRTLHQLTKQLSKMLSRDQHRLLDINTQSGKKRTLKRRLDQLFDKSSNKSQYSWSVKSHLWMESILYQFFLGKFIDDPVTARNNKSDPTKRVAALSKSLAHLSDSTYPPTRNRVHFERNLKILIEAREMALQYPVFWNEKAMSDSGYYIKSGKTKGKNIVPKNKKKSNKISSEVQRIHAEKTQSQLTQEGEIILEILMHKLPQPHFERMMNELGKFAEIDGDLAEQKRESWYIDDEGNSSKSRRAGGAPNKVKPLKEIATKEKKQSQITVLGTALHKISSSHSHLVAAELGRYLYVEVPVKSINDEDEKSVPSGVAAADSNEELILDTITMHPKDSLFAIRKHRKLNDVDRKYQKLQDNFVKKMIRLQHEFASLEDTAEESGDLHDDFDENNDDITADLMVKEFQREQVGYKSDVRKHQQEELTETLLELRKMGLRQGENVQKRRGRPSKGLLPRLL